MAAPKFRTSPGLYRRPIFRRALHRPPPALDRREGRGNPVDAVGGAEGCAQSLLACRPIGIPLAKIEICRKSGFQRLLARIARFRNALGCGESGAGFFMLCIAYWGVNSLPY